MKNELLLRRTTRSVDDIVDNTNVDNRTYCDEDPGQLLVTCLSPLLKSMRLCGLYFNDGRSVNQTSLEDKPVSQWRSRLTVIYAVVLCVLLWMNGVRMVTVFTPTDNNLPTILFKLMFFCWNIQCAMQQTAYFVASRTGALDEVLDDIHLKSTMCSHYVHRLSFNFAFLAWSVAGINFAFFIYNICLSGGANDLQLVPFGTYVNVSDMVAIRRLYIVLSVPLHTAWCFPVIMTFMLSMIFAHQFRYVAERLRKTVNDANEGGLSAADIEEIRQQHQTLCRTVQRADSFLKLFHLASFCCPLITIIAIAYTLLFHSTVLNNNKVLMYVMLFWLSTGFVQLSLTVVGGIMVNHYVSINGLCIQRNVVKLSLYMRLSCLCSKILAFFVKT